MDKSSLTTSIALLVTILGFFIQQPYGDYFLYAGLFALSGALTNWLAIHMLFEKIPFLYGSGVITQNFEKFKKSIHTLVMEQFFTKEHIEQFVEKELSAFNQSLDFEALLNDINLDPAFENFKQVILQSPFGGMLNMFGGEAALTPLKEPFLQHLKESIIDITKDANFQEKLSSDLDIPQLDNVLMEQIESIVKGRLELLTPNHIKEMIHQLIKQHLGWLVVWGGVFGGVIGLISSLFL